MHDSDKSRKELINELNDLREKISSLSELSNKTQLYQEAIQHARINIWEYDIEKDSIQFHIGHETFWGLDNSIASMDEFISLIHPEDVQLFEQAIDEVIEKTGETQVNHRIIKQSTEEIRWIKSTIKYHHSSSEHPNQIVAYSHDITEKVQLDNKVHQYETKYKNLFNKAPVGIFTTNSNGEALFVNPKMAEIVGCSSPEEAVAIFDDLSQKLYVNTDRRQTFINLLKKNGSVENFEYEAVRTDGSHIWLSMNARIREQFPDGSFIIDGFTVDITKRKNAEEKVQYQQEEIQMQNEELRVSNEELIDINEQLTEYSKRLGESQEKYHGLFEYMGSGVAIYEAVDNGKNFIFKNLNRAAVRIEDIKKEDIIGKRVTTVFPGIKEFGLLDIFQKVYNTGNPEHHKVSLYIDNRITGWRENYVYKLASGEIVAVYEDMTEQKKAQQELQTIFDMSLDLICIADIDTTCFKKVNPAFTEELGYSQDELIGQSFLDFIHPEDIESTKTVVKDSLQQGKKVINFENRYRTKDGDYRWFLWVSHPNTETGLTYAIAHDITERKQAAQKLKESQRFLQNVFDGIQDGLSIIDPNLTIVQVNDWIEKTYEDEMPAIGKKCYKIYHNRTSPCPWCPSVKTLSTGEINEQEIKVSSSNGFMWFKLSSYPLKDKDNNITGVIEHIKDITARKTMEDKLRESKERLQLALKGADLGLWDWNIQTGEVTFNIRWASMLGYRLDAIEPHVDSWEELVHPDDLSSVKEALENHINGKTPFYETEHRMKAKDGTWKWILDRGKVLEWDDQGNPLRAVGTHLDITIRKEMEQDLRDREQFLQNVFDAIQDGISVLDTDFNILKTNLWMEQKYSEQIPIKGKKCYKVYQQRQSICPWCPISNAIETGETHTEIVPYPTADNPTGWIELTGFPLKDNHGAVTSVIEYVKDITERKKAEIALQESRKRLIQAQYLAKIGDFIWDVETNEVIWSDGLYDLLKYDKSEKIDYSKVNEKIHHPEDLERVTQWLNDAIASQLDTLSPNEYRLIRNDGTVIDVRCIGVIKRREGKAPKIFATIQDITDQKQAEKKIQHQNEEIQLQNEELRVSNEELIDANQQLKEITRYLKESERRFRRAILDAPIPIMMHTEGKVLQLSSTWTEITGYTINDIPTIEAWTKKAYGKEKIDVKKVINQLYDKNEKVHEGEFEIKTKSGETRIWDFSTSPLGQLPDGKRIVVSMANDITNWKQTERKLRQANKELNRSNEELKNFAFVASHDLKEPLRQVISFSQLFAHRFETKIDKKSMEYINYIIDGTEQMESLINDILSFSRITMQEKAFTKINLESTLYAALHNLSIIIEENNAQITHDSLPTVSGDKSQIMQVFQNLIHNAIKFRKKDIDPEIHITAEEEQDYWKISIRDNGIGINPEFTEKIFTIFQRLHTKDEYTGTGIGLSICKKIIIRHEGKIWVESEPGNGATFIFTLPKR